MKPTIARRLSPIAGILAVAAIAGGQATYAQSPAPTPTSPQAPTPYDWMNYQNGGVPSPGTYTDQSLVPMAWEQSQGTPSGIALEPGTAAPANIAQIPSFDLGNWDAYDYFGPGGGGVNEHTAGGYPPGPGGAAAYNHLRDGGILSWSAPFTFLINNGSNPGANIAISLDDSQEAVPTGWSVYTDSAGTTGAVDGEYSYAPVNAGTGPFVWTFAGGVSTTGYYTVVANIPNDPSPAVETRISDAQYTITDTTTNTVLAVGPRVSQVSQQADELVAGPVMITAGDNITVSLATTSNETNLPSNAHVVADQITLTQSSGTITEGGAAAINVTDYPEVANARCFGITPGSPNTPDSTVYGPTGSTPPAASQEIRQLVYFGGAEMNAAGTHHIGVVYCVDGFRGNVVWRYALPDWGYDNAVQTTPVVARIMVYHPTPPGSPPPTAPVQTLVVIFADNLGHVYCVDAIGSPFTQSGAPIASLVIGSAPTQAQLDAQVGTTPAYWIYRPDPSNPTSMTTVDDTSATAAGETPVSPTSPSCSVTPGCPSTWTTQAEPTATGGSYQWITTDSVANTSSPGNPATMIWSFSIANAVADSYTASVHIPSHNAGETNPWSTDAEYTVSVNGTTVLTTREDQTNPINNYLFLTFPISTAGPTTVNVVLDNSTLSGSTPTGTDVVADSVSLSESTAVDPTSQMPIPGPFDQDSPAIYVPPGATGTPNIPGSGPGTDGYPVGNTAYLYITNTNGTIYALNPEGAVPGADSNSGYDTLPVPGLGSNTPIPYTPTTNWWFTLRGAQGSDETATITSAPSILVYPGISGSNGHRIYFASSKEIDGVQSAGRVYAIDYTGPVDNGGNLLTPGSTAFNLNSRPAWSFPDAYGPTSANGAGISTNTGATIEPPLGDITGSPVPFYNPDSGNTRIYFAADTGLEEPVGGSVAVRADTGTTGRIWSIQDYNPLSVPNNNNSQQAWAFPTALDPNQAASYTTAEPSNPIGAFMNATPAIGMVAFPSVINYFNSSGTATAWVHNDAYNSGGVTTRSPSNGVPMLYVGTAGDLDIGFYALDLDGGATGSNTYDDQNPANELVDDTNRLVYRLESPNGFAWETPPVLISNPTPEGPSGFGGAVYAVGGNTLYQIEATPVTNLATDQPYPYVGVDTQFQGFGALTPIGIAAANVADIDSSGVDPNEVSDWIYCADQNLGVFRGITSGQQGYGGDTSTAIQDQSPVDTVPPTPVLLSMPLKAYIAMSPKALSTNWTNLTPGPASSSGSGSGSGGGGLGGVLNMNSTDPTTFFDWGQPVYIRITNVLPPNPGDTGGGYAYRAPYPYIPGDYVTAVSSVTYTVQSVLPTGGIGQNANLGGSNTLLWENGNTASGEGFFARTGITSSTGGYPGCDDGSATAAAQSLIAQNPDNTDQGVTPPTQFGYASVYYLDSNSQPGSMRRLVNVTQQAEIFKGDISAQSPGTYVGTVALTAEAGQGAQVPVANESGPPTMTQIVPAPQPTFGVANPIAIAGEAFTYNATQGSAPVALSSLGYAQASGTFPNFPPEVPLQINIYPNTADSNNHDFDSAMNGNQIYENTSEMPTAGVYSPNSANGDPTNYQATNGGGQTQTPAYNPIPAQVYTSTGYVQHNQTGSNAGDDSSGDYQGYLLQIADRSQSGLRNEPVSITLNHPIVPEVVSTPAITDLTTTQAVGMPAHWKDYPDPDNTYGPSARINPLPWEDMPVDGDQGTNRSLDYPDIPSSALDCLLHLNAAAASATDQAKAGSLNNGGVVNLDSAQLIGSTQTNYTDTLEVDVHVPKYQPANLSYLLFGTDKFAGGYIAHERVFVPAPNTTTWSQNDAFRDFDILVGVPPTAATHIGQSTIDIGAVPAGFGVQMSPSPTNDPFDPFDPYFQRFFKPFEVYNDGNVNLLNVHLIQQQPQDDPLEMLSSTVDSSAGIPGYDYSGVTIPPTDPDDDFLVRSSLDEDLVIGHDINPGMINATNPVYPSMVAGASFNSLYQGPTFHKARVGSNAPTLLTVPDVPGYNTTVGVANPWYLPVTTAPPSSVASTGPTAATLPYVSVEVPFGTPVGTYSTNIGVYDGFDAGLQYEYGSQQIETSGTAPGWDYGTNNTPTTGSQPSNDIYIPPTPSSGSNSYYAMSNPGATLKVTVTENQITDAPPDSTPGTSTPGTVTAGVLPQVITTVGTGTVGSPDIFPAALRDFYWNGSTAGGTSDLGLLWNSVRSGGSGSGISLYTSGVAMESSSDPFYQALVGSNSSSWWGGLNAVSLSGLPSTSITAYDPTIAQDQEMCDYSSDNAFDSDGTEWAFFIDATSSGSGQPVTDQIYCANVSSVSNGGLVLGSANAIPLPDTSNGTLTNAASGVYGVRGLKFTLNNTLWPLEDPRDPAGGGSGTGEAIPNNLWAFWTAGGHGQTAIYYSSAAAQGAVLTQQFSAPFALPTPVGLNSVSYPSPALILAPDTTATVSGSSPATYPPAMYNSTYGITYPTVPLIELTYSGVDQTGSAHIYTSRYRPYYPNYAEYNTLVGLTSVPYPSTTEVLAPDSSDNWWSARDIGWDRNTGGIQIVVGSISGGGSATSTSLFTYNNSSSALNTAFRYDKASGLLIATNIATNSYNINTVYIDLPHGRVRFGLTGSPTALAGAQVYAIVNPTARRITTNPTRSDTEPVSIVDAAFKPALLSTSNNEYYVQAARKWYIFRGSGSSAKNGVTGTLWYTTQRLGIALYCNTTGAAATCPISASGVHVSDSGVDVTPYVDVDAARGMIYFPLVYPSASGLGALVGQSPEGHTITVTATPVPTQTNSSPSFSNASPDYYPAWIDEPRYTDASSSPGNGSVAVVTAAGTSNTYETALAPTTANESAVPMNVSVNEDMPYAFLDPWAYSDVANGPNRVPGYPLTYTPANPNGAATFMPHDIWLFWSSTRNAGCSTECNTTYAGNASQLACCTAACPNSNSTCPANNPSSDLYYEVLNPNFSAN